MFAISTELRDLAREGDDAPPPSVDEFARYVQDLGARGAVVAPGHSPVRLRVVLETLPVAGCPVLAIASPNPRPDGFERHPEWLAALSLSDAEDARRVVAERAARRTIELAAERRVGDVIVDLGSVVWPEDAVEAEDQLASVDLSTSSLVERYVRASLEIRARFAPAQFDAARRSLDALLPAAERLGVVLSVRAPARVAAIPAFRELETIAREFDGAPLGVWADAAGAFALSAMKLKPADSWIRTFAARLRGIDLADAKHGDAGGLVRGLRPGEGAIDFAALLATLREACGERPVVCALACGVEGDRGLTRESVSHLRRAGWLA